MSELLRDHSNFLSLILNTDPIQQKSLLDSITPSQALLIGEIFLNLLNIEHEDKDFSFLKNKIRVLESLSKRNLSARYRRSLVRKHKVLILKILLHFKDNLSKLI